MGKMTFQLSDHFTFRRLLRFTLPSVVMLIFTTIYGVVDGLFVSNFVGKTSFAAVNFIMPVLIILGCAGFMFGTGGGALIAKTLGQGKRERANELFSMVVYAALLCGILLAVIGFVSVRPVAVLMGAEGPLLENSVLYGKITLLALPFFILQYEFQCLFATAGKTDLGLTVTVAAGLYLPRCWRRLQRSCSCLESGKSTSIKLAAHRAGRRPLEMASGFCSVSSCRYSPKYSAGSMASPSLVTLKCRCAPSPDSDRDVLPTVPSTVPASTSSPTSTGTSSCRLA